MTASIISRVIDAAAAGAGAGCLESRVWRVTTSGAGVRRSRGREQEGAVSGEH